MLSDARSLWKSASNALVALNENISNALENLETDPNLNNDDEYQDTSFEVENDEVSEVEIYKNLLEEAQMNQVMLSNQSRLVLAEKEEKIIRLIELLKQNKIPIPENETIISNYKNENSSGDCELSYDDLKTEKKALEASLQYLQDQMKDLIVNKVEVKVLMEKNLSYQNRIKTLTKDFEECQNTSELNDRQKTEAIENLAEEYSKLAAEMELRHDRDQAALLKLQVEKEELITKMEAFQHSINEFADRAAAVPTR
jgi:hypothetical protein